MARLKPWIGRIPQLLQYFREEEQAKYQRREIQEIFGISSSTAIELMHVVGCKFDPKIADSGALVCSREKLVDYLTYGPEAQQAAQEALRRAKLAEKLNAAAKDQGLRSIKLMDRAQTRDWLLKDLANVNIENGVCTIVFTDAVDLLKQIYMLVQAAGAGYASPGTDPLEWEKRWKEFEKLCELRAQPAELPSGAGAEEDAA
jgi:hypothetical protein